MRKIVLLLLLFAGLLGTVSAAEYPYWIEDDGNGNYYIWTKVNVSANSDKVIYIKKVNGYHPNGTSVFEFFDDFEDGVIDTNKWQYPTSLDIVESGGYLRIAPTVDNKHTVLSIQTFSSGILELKAKYDYGVSNAFYTGFTPLNYDRLVDITTDAFGLIDIEYYSSGGYWINGVLTKFFTPLANTWRKYITGFDGAGNVFFEVDGTRATATFSPANPVYVHISDKNIRKYTYVDYIFVRKYADQEPTTSISQLGPNTWKITISNPNNYDVADFQVKLNGIGIVSSTSDSVYVSDVPPPISGNYITTSTTQDIYPIGSNVVLSIHVGQDNINDTININWGDGQSSSIIATANSMEETHLYEQEGTYTIVASTGNVSAMKTITVSASVVDTTLNFLSLYEGMNISDIGISIDSGITMKYQNHTNNTVIRAYMGKPIKIQTEQGYITSVKAINGNVNVYIGDTSVQYVPCEYSTQKGSFVSVNLNGKEIAYGNPIVATIPVNSVVQIFVDGRYIKDQQITQAVKSYIQKPTIFTTTNWYVSNGKIYISSRSTAEQLLFYTIQDEVGNDLYSTSYALKANEVVSFPTIAVEYSTNYTLTVRDGEGNIISVQKKSFTGNPTQTAILNGGATDWALAILSIVFIIPILLLSQLTMKNTTPFVMVLGGAIMLVIPFRFPYLDRIGGILVGLGFMMFIIQYTYKKGW